MKESIINDINSLVITDMGYTSCLFKCRYWEKKINEDLTLKRIYIDCIKSPKKKYAMGYIDLSNLSYNHPCNGTVHKLEHNIHDILSKYKNHNRFMRLS